MVGSDQYAMRPPGVPCIEMSGTPFGSPHSATASVPPSRVRTRCSTCSGMAMGRIYWMEPTPLQSGFVGVWLSLVERWLRESEVESSNLSTPTIPDEAFGAASLRTQSYGWAVSSSRLVIVALACGWVLIACASVPRATVTPITPTFQPSPSQTAVPSGHPSVTPTKSAARFVCIQAPAPTAGASLAAHAPTVVDETGLVDHCLQPDVIDTLHGRISVSNPFDSAPNLLHVQWALATCDASISFTFSVN